MSPPAEPGVYLIELSTVTFGVTGNRYCNHLVHSGWILEKLECPFFYPTGAVHPFATFHALQRRTDEQETQNPRNPSPTGRGFHPHECPPEAGSLWPDHSLAQSQKRRVSPTHQAQPQYHGLASARHPDMDGRPRRRGMNGLTLPVPQLQTGFTTFVPALPPRQRGFVVSAVSIFRLALVLARLVLNRQRGPRGRTKASARVRESAPPWTTVVDARVATPFRVAVAGLRLSLQEATA